MFKITVEDILKVTQGRLVKGNKKLICEDFCKDTRNIKKGDTYLGIKGDRINGGLFWMEAVEKGASCVIVQEIEFDEKELRKYSGATIIEVENVIKALGQIAKFKRENYDIPIVAITGSVGKTTTKDMIYNVLSKKYNTLKTQGNYNNHIGLPFTLMNLKDQEAAIIEMGMNHEGEIRYLSNITKPTISVITNIGTSHIGNLGSRENILRAKLEILEGMDSKVLVLNNDNDLLHNFKLFNQDESIDIKTFGIKNDSQISAEIIEAGPNYSNIKCYLNEFRDESIDINIPVGGIHSIYNALCAVCVGKMLDVENEKIKEAIESFESSKNRMNIDLLPGGIKIINDAYNASFESMKAALGYLGEFKDNRTIAVLGDMFELGEYSEELHKKVGEEVVKNNIDVLICCGENSKYIIEQAVNKGFDKRNTRLVKEKDDIVKLLKDKAKYSDTILFKASNGMKFYEVADEVKKALS